MKIPKEIKEKILLAGEYYEKARIADGDVYEWLRSKRLVQDDDETPVEECFIESVRMGDGDGAPGFIAYLEDIKEFGWECQDSKKICYFSIKGNHDGDVLFNCHGCMSRIDREKSDSPSWKLTEFLNGKRYPLSHDELHLLEKEPEMWRENNEGDWVDYLTDEEAAKYHESLFAGSYFLPTLVDCSTPCGWYYFTF